MNASQEDILGMFIKCKVYLTDNHVKLAGNPFFADAETKLDENITAIILADSIATRNLKGFTTGKGISRKDLELLVLTVAGACRGYYTTHNDPAKKALIKFTRTFVEGRRDGDLLVVAATVLSVAQPIKASLAPWDVTSAMVDDLSTKTNDYRDMLQAPRTEQIKSQVAGRDVDELYSDTMDLLHDADDQFAVYEFTSPALYNGWQLSRAIDDSGGASDTTGFDVQLLTVPALGSVNFFTGALDGAKKLYIRVIGGNGIIACTTDTPTGVCVAGSGFVAQPGHTYKQTLTAMGLDLSKTNLQFTNGGTLTVQVRAGFEV